MCLPFLLAMVCVSGLCLLWCMCVTDSVFYSVCQRFVSAIIVRQYLVRVVVCVCCGV